VKPDSFAAVMATGIVSIAGVDHGYPGISDVRIGDRVCGPEDRLPRDAVLGHRDWRVPADDGADRLRAVRDPAAKELVLTAA
jgi:hypothetical protein